MLFGDNPRLFRCTGMAVDGREEGLWDLYVVSGFSVADLRRFFDARPLNFAALPESN